MDNGAGLYQSLSSSSISLNRSSSTRNGFSTRPAETGFTLAKVVERAIGCSLSFNERAISNS